MDIHGSNTRAELAIELANYHDELEALKAKQHRVHDARTAILNPISRSSSGVCVAIVVFHALHYQCFLFSSEFSLNTLIFLTCNYDCTFFPSLSMNN